MFSSVEPVAFLLEEEERAAVVSPSTSLRNRMVSEFQV